MSYDTVMSDRAKKEVKEKKIENSDGTSQWRNERKNGATDIKNGQSHKYIKSHKYINILTNISQK